MSHPRTVFLNRGRIKQELILEGVISLFVNYEQVTAKRFNCIAHRKKIVQNWYSSYPNLKDKNHFFQILYDQRL